MRRKPPRRFLRPALLVAAAFGVVAVPAQSAPPVSIAASDTPKDASAWSVMPIDELRQRANKNEVGAMEEIGRRLLAGDGVPRDVHTGTTWFQLAANAGSPMAAFTLGVLYERGISVERDSAKAVEWYRKAEAGNVAAAKHNLALMLRDGKGVAQDGPKALELLRAAAHQGMTASMFTLGDMYERGGAVLKDPAAALAWFSIAYEFELKANNGTETPLAKSAQARGQTLERMISGTDRERTEKIGKDEFRQIVVALTPPRPPPRPTLPLPPMPVPPPAAASAAATNAAAAAPAPGPAPAPAPAPSAAAEEPQPQPAWPKAAVDQVKAVQQALVDQHRLRGKADGAAGPATRAAIREFEKSAGLPETGQASREVYLALVKAKAQRDPPAPPAPEPDAAAWPAKGADQIRAIQQLLVELKLLNAEPTGTVGPLTKRAIRDYQRKSGLKETGEPSQVLFDSLKAARAKAGC
jgi:peptidoglycan hydrolase-like protein with peptidoglycan-binding domain